MVNKDYHKRSHNTTTAEWAGWVEMQSDDGFSGRELTTTTEHGRGASDESERRDCFVSATEFGARCQVVGKCVCAVVTRR